MQAAGWPYISIGDAPLGPARRTILLMFTAFALLSRSPHVNANWSGGQLISVDLVGSSGWYVAPPLGSSECNRQRNLATCVGRL